MRVLYPQKCVFLDNDGRCTVHAVRPLQCATYPYWPVRTTAACLVIVSLRPTFLVSRTLGVCKAVLVSGSCTTDAICVVAMGKAVSQQLI